MEQCKSKKNPQKYLDFFIHSIFSGYFPDDASNAPNPPKPWNDLSQTASLDFLNAQDQWYKTWDQEGDNSALQIDAIRVYAL